MTARSPHARGIARDRDAQQRALRNAARAARRVLTRAGRIRLCRRPQRDARTSVGEQSSRSNAGLGGGLGPPPGRRHRHHRGRRFEPGCQDGHNNNTYRVRQRLRPGQGRSRRQPQPPGRQPHGRKLPGEPDGPKRLELLSELAPAAAKIGMLVNPDNPNAETDTRDAQSAAGALGKKLVVAKARTERDLDTQFATFVHQQIGAVSVDADPFSLPRASRSLRSRPCACCPQCTRFASSPRSAGS